MLLKLQLWWHSLFPIRKLHTINIYNSSSVIWIEVEVGSMPSDRIIRYLEEIRSVWMPLFPNNNVVITPIINGKSKVSITAINVLK